MILKISEHPATFLEPLCKYFLQLEDDVLAKRDFMRYIDGKVTKWQSWVRNKKLN